MFLHILEAIGAFLGGLGAFIAATTQLLTFLRKKEEEERVDNGEDTSAPWMLPTRKIAHPTASA